ncbi:S8 family serine peptidase [Tepidibacillus marianensis]|uniref:S8 family serine peptidase n=1 Tax=Tepidibacillus marianensis TaxID=3131995 RepID=UPI00386F08FC
MKVGVIDTGIDYKHEDLHVVGVAPQAELYAIKALDQSGNGNYSDIISGIEWAIANQMDIVNMSLGGTTSSKALKAAVDKAYNSGILLVASSGNYGTSMASPHVAGAAALLWESNPNLTNIQLRQLLDETAVTLGESFDYGNGVV